MPVNYTPPTSEQLLPVAGVVLGTAAAAIKNWTRDDVVLTLIKDGDHRLSRPEDIDRLIAAVKGF